MRPCSPVLSILVSLAVFAATPAAIADATSKVPEKFKSDTYIEADYEDFCTGQSSGRACIEVTIKNSSMSVVDIRDNSLDGSLSGTGALEAFQVFEARGCVKRYQLSADVRAHLGPDETYSRRMRQENLHYWKDGRHKTIKVLRGCTYAIAVKREKGDHKWQYSYIPPSAKRGCEIDYRYITSKADLKAYERWATFGALGGEGAAGLTGLINTGFFTGASYYSQMIGIQETIAGQSMLETALENGVLLGGETLLILVVATAAYEAGLWSAYGIDQLVRDFDGKRDFILGKQCY